MTSGDRFSDDHAVGREEEDEATTGRRNRIRWAIFVPLVAVAAVLGIGTLYVIRYTDMPAYPLAPIALGLAFLSAMAGLLLGVLRAHEVAE